MAGSKVAPESEPRATGPGNKYLRFSCPMILLELPIVLLLLPFALAVVFLPCLRLCWLRVVASCFPRNGLLFSVGGHVYLMATMVACIFRARGNFLIAYLRYFKLEYTLGLASIFGWEPGISPLSFMNTQSQPTLSSQASAPAAMRTRPLRAFWRSDPALWTVWEGASGGGDGTGRGQIAGDDGSGDGLNRDQRFGVSGQTSDAELIQTLQSMREVLRQELR